MGAEGAGADAQAAMVSHPTTPAAALLTTEDSGGDALWPPAMGFDPTCARMGGGGGVVCMADMVSHGSRVRSLVSRDLSLDEQLKDSTLHQAAARRRRLSTRAQPLLSGLMRSQRETPGG